MTRPMSCTATSNCHCSMRITTSVASRRSTSTTPPRVIASSPSCVPAKPPAAGRCAPICAVWCGGYGGTGPNTVITIRGDSHYGRREAMDWCEENAVQYVFGLSKNETLDALVFAKADEVRPRRAIGNLDAVRDFTETRYAAKSWSHPRRVVARIEATRKGLDIRYVVTSIARCDAASLYSGIYCAGE